MKQWIRLPGLIAFALILGLVAGVYFVIGDDLIEDALTDSATKANGAKVEMAEFEIELAPFQFLIEGMEVADKDNPMRNLFEFEKAEVKVDWVELLFGKVIIRNVELSGLKFNTERTTSGAVDLPPQPEDPNQEPPVAVTLPTADDLLAAADLLTIKEGKAALEFYEQSQATLGELWQQLPDDARFAEYQQAFSDIRNQPLNSLEDAQAMQLTLEKQLARMAQDKAELVIIKQRLADITQEGQQRLQALASAPGKDAARLVSEYGLNQQGLVNAATLLLGDEVGQYTQKAVDWYNRVQPWLQYLPAGGSGGPASDKPPRLTGEFVHFPSNDPLPSFLLEQALISMVLESGAFEVTLKEATNDQTVRNLPTTLSVSGTELVNMSLAQGNLTWDRRQPQPKLVAQGRVEGWQQPAKQWLELKGLVLKTEQATSQWQFDVAKQDGRWSGDWQANFADLNWNNQGQGGINGRLADRIAKVDRFDMGANLSGDGFLPSMALYTSLDEQIRDLVKDEVEAQTAKLKAEIKARLDEQKDQYLQQAKQYQDKLTERAGELKQIEARFDQQVAEGKRTVQERIDAEKRKYQQQLDAQKAKAEAAAQAAKDKAAKEKAELEAKLQAEKEEAERIKKEKEKQAADKAKEAVTDQLKDNFGF